MVDLAIGVIIGAAFGRIVESLVGDMIMPIFGASLAGSIFRITFFALSKDVTPTNLADAKKQGAVLAWGNFLTIAINFAIVAGALFLVVKGINFLRRKAAARRKRKLPPNLHGRKSCWKRYATCWRRRYDVRRARSNATGRI